MESEIATKAITRSQTRKQPKPFLSLLVFFNQILCRLGLLSLTESTQKQKKPSAHLIAPSPIPISLPSKTQEADVTLPKVNDLKQEVLYRKVANIYQTINNPSLGKFTLSFADSVCNELDLLVDFLIPLTREGAPKFVSAIDNLITARNELVLVIDYYGLEEVNPVYRLVLCNKAILTVRNVLYDVLLNWPLQSLRTHIQNFICMNRLPGDVSTPPPLPPPRPPEKKDKKKKK